MFRFLDGILDRVFCLIGALVFSQFPLFVNAYVQRLSGHVDELDKQLKTLKKLAGSDNLEPYISKFLTHGDPDFHNQGLFMKNMVLRYSDLKNSLASLTDHPGILKPWAFLNNFYPTIAEGTWNHFKPGLLLTMEGASYVILGALLGYVVYSFIKNSGRLFSRLVSFFKVKYIN